MFLGNNFVFFGVCVLGFFVNFVVYIVLVEFYGRIMGLDLFDGGYLIYGFMIDKKKIFVIFIFFEFMFYKVGVRFFL